MKPKLYTTALIASPIIGLYGASPFLIFDKVDFSTFVELLGGITLGVFINWIIVIALVLKYPKLNNIIVFGISYFLVLGIRLFIFWISSSLLRFPEPPITEEEFLYPIATSFAVNIIIIIIAKSIITAYEKGVAEKELQEIKLQNSEAQKQILMQQLQPHFLFNALSTLKALIGENIQLAEEYTLKLSDFLRYSIQSNNTELMEVKDELAFVQDYIDLQKMRFADSFEFTVHVDERILNKKIPILALQILVENIFKHNYFTEKNKLHFQILGTIESLKVSNNRSSVKMTERTRTGLRNLNMRYELIFGKSILIEENEDSYAVTLPL